MIAQFLSQAVAGCLAGWSLIVAVGPQNAFVLRQGLRRSHLGAVLGICIAADCVLIALGNLGIGALVTAAPWLLVALRWAGVAYLVFFAVQSFRAALRAEGLTANADDESGTEGDAPGAKGDAPGAQRGTVGTRRTLAPVLVTTLAITFLNPGVYLDTMALLGTLAHQSPGNPWWFSIGAACGSISWFLALGFGARALSPLVASPKTWRWIDAGIGVVVLALAVRLALHA